MSSQEVSFCLKSQQIIIMANSNGNNVDRLDRIEAIVESNSRTIQGILEQQVTDRLRREEEKAQHEARMRRLEDTVIRLNDTVVRLTRIEEGQNKMLVGMDEDRPTVLRRLMAIENKIDRLCDRQ